MITIDQLLESVDLDFEPRFVTKDENGNVNIWSEKPYRRSTDWDCELVSAYATVYEGLKLAEFENKPWQECIYEVPRKTTGKIERFTLEDFVCITDIEDSIRNVLDGRAFDKLNALVDAVNKHADIIQQIGEWGTSKGECLWCEKLTSVNLGG